MEKSKRIPAVPMRLMCLFLALICMLGLLPSTAFAASPDTIVMEDCTHNGVYYESAALSTCWLHQMKFDFNGDTVMGFCADHGGGMGWSLNGHKWDSPKAINDQTVKIMMAYFYAHSRGIFTDQAHALGVDEVWGSDYTWTMNAWVQAVVWRYKQGTLNDPAAVCAEELMYVYNNLEHTNYTSIDDVVDGTTLRDRAQYILDLGAQGVWGDCEVYEYDYAGPGSAQHPADDVQGIIIGDLTITRERYQFTIKKVDATNPNKTLPGARFLVQNANGTFEKEVVTGSDGTVTLTNLDASTYGLDCSGFTEWVYQTALGVTLYDGSWNQWDATHAITEEELLPGDLGFMAVPGTVPVNHVLLYAGKDADGKKLWVHCASSTGVVLNSPDYVTQYPLDTTASEIMIFIMAITAPFRRSHPAFK